MAKRKQDTVPVCDINILTTRRVDLVEQVVLENVMPSVKLLLLYTQVDAINAERSRDEKIGKLIDNLQMRVLAGEYQAFNAFIQSLAGTQPELFNTVCGRAPTVTESDFCMDKVVQEMKTTIDSSKHHTDSELDEQIDFQYEYVELSMVDKADKKQELASQGGGLPHDYSLHLDKVHSRDRNISACDVLGSQGNPFKHVSIFGRAGVGKSTTMQFWAKQWAQGKWAVGFTMLFLLQLRFITTQVIAISTVELLQLYGLYPVHSDSTPFTYWLRNCTSRILILIDGLDEIPGFAERMMNTPRIHDILQKAHPVDLCINILRGDLLPGCTVISASRPFAGLSQLPVDAKAEILGLTSAKVTEYVEHRHPHHVKNIMSVLGKNPILLSVCSITFYCMMITRLLSEGVTILDEDIKTYTRLMSFITVQYCMRKIRDCSFIMEVTSYFSKLAQVAYSGIFLREDNEGLAKIVFDEDDLIKSNITPQDLDNIKKTGILQVTRRMVGRHESWIAEFFHLSAQELLAVAYFQSTSPSQTPIFQQLFSSGQFSLGLLFMFGLQFDRQSSWNRTICKSVNCSFLNTSIEAELSSFIDKLRGEGVVRNQDGLRICQLIHEGQWMVKAKELCPYIAPHGGFYIGGTPMTAIDLLAVDFVCSESLKEISLSNVNANDSFVSVMISSLVTHNLQTLQTLDIAQNNISDAGATAIAMVKIPQLKKLNLGRNKIGNEGVNAVSNMLEDNACLEDLHLDSNPIGEEGAKALAKSLKKNTCLRRLWLSYSHVDGSGVQAVGDMLRVNNSLELLYLISCGFGDMVEALTESLCINTTLTRLSLGGNQIDDVGVRSIAKLLCKNPSLQVLDISHNQIGDEGAQAIADSLVCNTSLRMLDISDQGGHTSLRVLDISVQGHYRERCLGDAGAIAIAGMWAKNSTLVKLHISDNKIGDAGAVAIAGAVRSKDAGEELELDMGIEINIRNNKLGPYGKRALADVQQHNAYLVIRT